MKQFSKTINQGENGRPQSLATIEAIKLQPPFRRLDIVLYGLLACLILLLFWRFVFGSAALPLQAVEIWRHEEGEQLVLRYVFGSGAFEMDPAWAERITVENRADGYDVTISSLSEAGGYNTLAIRAQGQAFMLEANCSRRMDCTHFPPISQGEQVIICVPHQLVITGIGESGAAGAENDVDVIVR